MKQIKSLVFVASLVSVFFSISLFAPTSQAGQGSGCSDSLMPDHVGASEKAAPIDDSGTRGGTPTSFIEGSGTRGGSEVGNSSHGDSSPSSYSDSSRSYDNYGGGSSEVF